MSLPQKADSLSSIIHALQRELTELQRSVAHGVEVVEALPENPVEGQEVYLQTAAMAAQGVLWRLRYNAQASSSFKWESVGGAPLQLITSGVIINQSANEWKPANAAETVVIPTAGVYDVELYSWFLANTSGATNLAHNIAKTSALTTPLLPTWQEVTDTAGGSSQYNSLAGRMRFTSAGAQTITTIFMISNTGVYQYTVEACIAYIYPVAI